MPAFCVHSEYGALSNVILGTGTGYHRDPDRVEVVNATQAATFASSGRPAAAKVEAEFSGFGTALTAAGVTVHEPRLAPASVQDQTCPRDIGFVIGETFVEAGMRASSRVEEIDGIRHILDGWTGPRLRVPPGLSLEGGDVIVDGDVVYVGAGQRSDAAGAEYLSARFGQTHRIIALPTTPASRGEEVLHLDCTFQPLGLGHALIYPGGLARIPAVLRDRYAWIELTRAEAAALATNILSLAPDHLIARSHPACARINSELRAAGYRVTEVDFDAVPSTGGSFRCATLPLRRS